jgi:hypothetical protein
MQNDNNDRFDMVKALEIVAPFSGRPDEDVDVWVRDIELVARITGWYGDELYRLTLLALKGEAHTWSSEVVGGRVGRLNFSKFKELLRKRFRITQRQGVRLPKFCIYHGKGYHVSKSCKELAQILIIERSRINRRGRHSDNGARLGDRWRSN